MDIVSFETAKKLKKAGFPQPAPVFGQAWYSKDRAYFLFYKIRTEAYFSPIDTKYGVRRIELQEVEIHNFFNELIYAPSATDILRKMPDYAIAFDDSQRPHGFTCYDAMRRQPQLKQFRTTHENPAEAAAEMYLSLNATEFEMKITGKLNDTVND